MPGRVQLGSGTSQYAYIRAADLHADCKPTNHLTSKVNVGETKGRKSPSKSCKQHEMFLLPS